MMYVGDGAGLTLEVTDNGRWGPAAGSKLVKGTGDGILGPHAQFEVGLTHGPPIQVEPGDRDPGAQGDKVFVNAPKLAGHFKVRSGRFGPQEGPGGDIFVTGMGSVGDKGWGPSPSCPAWSLGHFYV